MASDGTAAHESAPKAVFSKGPPPIADAQPPAIEARDLTKHYGKVAALAGLTMKVPRGEVFGFLGPNGAGKTTAVKLFVGLARPASGQAWVLGAPVGDRRVRQKIGYLPELFRYQSWLSAEEVLSLHCELAGVPRQRRRGEMDRVLTSVGLADRAKDRVGTFSKGMQQRLGLGVALLGEPEVVFLDEPTSALDPIGRHEVREIIRDLRARDTTVFLNSHLLGEVELVCDRAAVVDHGRVIAIGTIPELLGASNSVRVRVTGLDPRGAAALQRFGSLTHQGDWLAIIGIADESVPDLVAEIVRLGGRVHAVEHQTLEDRFLQLVQRE